MNIDRETLIVLSAVVIALVVALAAWLIYRERQSQRLKARFGPEYGRAVEHLGSRTKAESELKARETRVERLRIVPLSPADAERFAHDWKLLQGRFVDNPKGVLAEADQLVRDLMTKRGYPMADFARRAADISVDHPAVVQHYRAAQAIALRDERGEADTEELRKGVVHYRALFQDLLEISDIRPMPARHADAEVHS